MTAHLVKTDKNGTEYWVDHTCSKCYGKGYIEAYNYVDGGICYQCHGTGLHTHTWKVYTEEYEAKLIERRIARAKKKAPEKNAKFFKTNGADENGNVWVVMGDTFAIKDAIKEAGGRFTKVIGWHFDHAVEGFDLVQFSAEDWAKRNDVDEWGEQNCYDEWSGEIRFPAPAIRQAQEQYTRNYAKGGYLGNVGDKLEVPVTVVRVSGFDTDYGWTSVYTMEDSNGNVIVWKSTSCKINLEKDSCITIAGRVKEHKEYKGVKQTILTRCKVA